MENTEVTVIEQPTELVEAAKHSGIELSKAELITIKYAPYLLKIREAEIEMKKINFENPNSTDILLAKEIRNKTLVKNRTDAEKFKASQKAEALLLNKLEDTSYNLVEAVSKVSELKLYNLEKAAEIAEKARIEATRLTRVEEIKQYGESYVTMDLGNMDEQMFQTVLTGAKMQHEAKIKAELEAEAARIEKEKQAAIAIENQRIENERLRKEKELADKALELERIEAKKIQDAKDAELKAANEKAEAEKKEAARIAKIESDKQAAIITEQKAKADKLAAELKAKADVELKAENDRIAAEKKAAKAPDKDKLKAYVLSLKTDYQFDLKTVEAAKVMGEINVKFASFKKWALTQIETL